MEPTGFIMHHNRHPRVSKLDKEHSEKYIIAQWYFPQAISLDTCKKIINESYLNEIANHNRLKVERLNSAEYLYIWSFIKDRQ